MSHSDRETVIISAGFSKTHVTTAAAEASARGSLCRCITGAYPTSRVEHAVRLFGVSERGRIARLLERKERIPEDRLDSLPLPELLYDLARSLSRVPLLRRLRARLCAATWRLYGRQAARTLRRAEDARIYHFRAGFGQASVPRAKELGMVTLCDHSAAHPLLRGELVENEGRLTATGPSERHVPSIDGSLERAILADLDAADAVVVNSAFVKQMFLALGWPAQRVHVIYLGVDDNFLRSEPWAPREPWKGPLRLLFAGLFAHSKGARTLIDALSGLREIDWELRIAGPVSPEILAAHASFLDDDRVTMLGVLRRPELMREMRSDPVFVFPSLAEGSARVVFEALACGCYVITTPNSGTIVEDEIHGALVPPGDAERLREAILRADGDRDRLAEIGNRNAQLVAERFSQHAYGDGLANLYRELSLQVDGTA